MIKKIKKVQIRNFQSHDDITLDIAPMLTTIVGPSDAGKSAVIRAIRWALFNEPSGTQYMRVGTDNTSVLITFTDGTTLLRARNKSENYYILQEAEGDPVRLEGFGVAVPQEINDFTGIRKVEVGDKDSLAVNIAGQLEGPFLLGEKSSVRAEAIGRLAGTDRIDTAHRTTNADKFSNQKRIGQLKLDAEKMQEQLGAFAYLKEEEKTIEQLTALTDRMQQLQDRLTPLIALQKKQKHHTEQMEITRKRKEQFAYLQKAKDLYTLTFGHQEQKTKLSVWKKEQDRLQKAIQETQQRLLSQNLFLSFVATEKLIAKGENLLRVQKWHTRQKCLTTQFNQAKRLASLPVDDATAVFASAGKTHERLNKLRRIQEQYQNRNARIQNGYAYLQRLEDTETAAEYWQEIQESRQRLLQMQGLREKNRLIHEQIQTARMAKQRSLQEVQKHTDAYIQKLADAKQCPYCRQTLDKDSLQHVRAHLEGEEHELREGH